MKRFLALVLVVGCKAEASAPKFTAMDAAAMVPVLSGCVEKSPTVALCKSGPTQIVAVMVAFDGVPSIKMFADWSPHQAPQAEAPK